MVGSWQAQLQQIQDKADGPAGMWDNIAFTFLVQARSVTPSVTETIYILNSPSNHGGMLQRKVLLQSSRSRRIKVSAANDVSLVLLA